MEGAETETVRAVYEAWNRGDQDAVLESFDPDIEWHPTEQFPEPGPVRGHDGMRRFFVSFEQVFGELRMEPAQILEGAEPGEVVAVVELLSRGKESGAEVTIRIAHRLRLRDGKVIWGKVYANAEEGLRAAGAEPSA